jgi:hypothetical protein
MNVLVTDGLYFLFAVQIFTRTLVNIYLSIRYHNSCRRLPETKPHSSLFLHRSGSTFLAVMAACTPSIQVFLGSPLFLLSLVNINRRFPQAPRPPPWRYCDTTANPAMTAFLATSFAIYYWLRILPLTGVRHGSATYCPLVACGLRFHCVWPTDSCQLGNFDSWN